MTASAFARAGDDLSAEPRGGRSRQGTFHPSARVSDAMKGRPMIILETDRLLLRRLLPWTIEDRPEVEVAYLLVKPYWGQGLATEAARAIAHYGFEQLDNIQNRRDSAS
jgi:Acetyltransferase (GNAT) domain